MRGAEPARHTYVPAPPTPQGPGCPPGLSSATTHPPPTTQDPESQTPRPPTAVANRVTEPAGRLLLAGLDAELAAHVATALLRYKRWLHDINRPQPDGFAELLKSSIRVAKSGQSHPVDAATRQRVRMARLLSPADAAAVLGISERTLRRRVADGTLPARHVGRLVRFDPHDILALGESA